MRGLQFARARIPVDAVDGKMMLIAGIRARFLRKNGEYSSQHLIGRSLLAKENSSIPREELEAITIGSNLLSHLGRTEFKGEVDSQQISQWNSSNYALKLVES